jgi:uncharacterized protein YjbI with pentapeptide repeats
MLRKYHSQSISGLLEREISMENEECMRLLKQGTQAWNTWRMQHPDSKRLNLSRSDLSGLDLHGVNFREVDLNFAKLSQVNLNQANLINVDMTYADLSSANLRETQLRHAIVMYANLDDADASHADLSETVFVEASFTRTNLRRANMSQADLTGSVLTEALFLETDISSATFANTTMYHTVFGGVDLHQAKGLQSVYHLGPSHLSVSTIIRSLGNLPDVFLRGTGTPEHLIQLLHASTIHSNMYWPCYITYSQWDKPFAERLYVALQDLEVRTWLFPKYTGKQGEWIRNSLDAYIEASMDWNDKVVLVISSHSVNSLWIETIVNNALEREAQAKHPTLFPCQIDNPIMETEPTWLVSLRKTHQILDFTQWKTKQVFDDKISELHTNIQEN